VTAGNDLDDRGLAERLDSKNVLDAVERFPAQCREAWAIGKSASGLPDAAGLDSAVVLGMGGSGVSGDVVQAVVEPRLPLTLRVIKSYGPLPEWVGRNTLVFAVSYSGSTEETIEALQEAHERGCRAVAISSGGPIEEIAREFAIAHVAIPAGLQPRASLGYLTLPILAVLETMGIVPDLATDFEEALKVLESLADRCDRGRPLSDNPAKDLARRIVGRVPVIYGGFGVGATAAYRFKCDLNEYGKTPAFWNVLPELDHNEIVGWDRLSELTSESFVLILLRNATEHARVSLRFEATRRLIESHFNEVVEVEAEGSSALSHLLSLVLVTQLAAIYVGLAYGVDPGPVEVIQKLKSELSRR
jgi:glucose/mannose-6-phosphate isomerase